MKSDIIIIGGGAAGLMAALGAAETLAKTENGGTVTVLEKMPKPGRKIMITGKGRCNFTNVKEWDSFSSHIRSDANFVSPSWHNLPPEKLIELFRSNGLRSVVERGDRAFPASHMAGDVVDTLVRACTILGVKIVPGCEVKSIEKKANNYHLDCTRTIVKEFHSRRDEQTGRPGPVRTETTIEPESYTCKKLIIATGGLSYPGTGSTGDGYRWAEAFGHTIDPLFPSLTAIVPAGYKEEVNPLVGEIKEAFQGKTVYGKRKERKINPLPANYPKLPGHIERITPLSDLGELLNMNSLENVELAIYIGDNEVQREFGDLDFTDGGIEGPIGFQVSRKVVSAIINGQKVSASIDLKPAVELEKLNEDVHGKWDEVLEDPRSKGQDFRRLFRIMLGKLIPWNITQAFLRMNPKVSVDTLASYLKNWKFDIEGFVGFERAVVTAGGVSTDEVVAKTLESKKSEGLYFCGEILDMDSDTGGYNLQTAFATGYLAGESAAKAL